MMRMQGAPRAFLATVGVVWAALFIAGWIYGQQLSIPAGVAAAVIAAFLIEAAFFLFPGFELLREAARKRLPGWRLSAALTASAALPYLAYSLPCGVFRWHSFAVLLLLAGLAGFWYVVAPRKPAFDVLFLALMAAALMARVFAGIHAPPWPRLRVDVLGHLMWIRTGVMAVLMLRGAEGMGFGFWPQPREWWIGLRNFLYFVLLGAALSLLSGFARFEPPAGPWWRTLVITAGTFLGMLWVVALSEEFFFRGLLQRWLCGWLRSDFAGLIAASLLFGAAHLPFRSFPNWRFALVAALAGLFYGRAYQQAGGIRAAMVAHALTNTFWRVVFA